MLADFTRKREREKTRSANIISTFMENTLFAYENQLYTAFDQITG